VVCAVRSVDVGGGGMGSTATVAHPGTGWIRNPAPPPPLPFLAPPEVWGAIGGGAAVPGCVGVAGAIGAGGAARLLR